MPLSLACVPPRSALSGDVLSDLREKEPGQRVIAGVALFCFLLWTGTSWARWADFAYRTFDLAYYVQALWQLSHGRLAVSVQYVPLLGNHVEPIVLLLTPLFFIFRHPMVFVVVQNAALVTIGPVGYRLARRLGFNDNSAFWLSGALLLAPATGYIALHEFHPEALTAPFILLMLQARQEKSIGRHWLWFLAVLACKENMAPLLAGYCAVHLLAERKRGFADLAGWFVWPMALALLWFVLCTKVITPAFNGGNIDYGALYDRLGNSGGEILSNAFTKPQLIFESLRASLMQGNLLPALLLPFLGLSLLRPKWLLIAAPVLLQHLLSWRSSEWTIYFHYAAPLLPLFWLAAIEAIAAAKEWAPKAIMLHRAAPPLMLAACLSGQILLGPATGMAATASEWFAGREERERKEDLIAAIPADASVLAPLPYLSHLAMRRELHSLHYVLKGLKTLSREAFDPPPPTDYVFIDYGDLATFDPVAGYYHPTMRALGGRIIPSSDRLLHEFLRRAEWDSRSENELTLLHRVGSHQPPTTSVGTPIFEIGQHTALLRVQKSAGVLSENHPVEITLDWRFNGEREVIPWMAVRFVEAASSHSAVLHRGLSAPEARDGVYEERWKITSIAALQPGSYRMEALFLDNAKGAWTRNSSAESPISLLAQPVPLGELRVE